jgi:hypothetical protein
VLVSKPSMRLRATLFLVCLTLPLVPSADGQTNPRVPSEADIGTLLRSTSAIDVAWGAFWAGHLRRSSMVSDLLRALESPPAAAEVDRELVAVEVLDALVQLDATVPAAVVRPYYDRWPVQALALWSKQTPARDEMLLELLGHARNQRWFAIANILLQTNVVGLAGVIVESPLVLHVTVTDPGVEAGIPGGVSGGVAGDLFEPTAPYPPVPEYRFSGFAAGRAVLSTGPHTVYYERRVTTRWTSRSGSDINGPSPAERVEYLAQIAKTTFSASPVVSVAWRHAADLERRVRTAQTSLRNEYDRVFGLVVSRGLLEAAEAQRLTAAIDVRLSDARTSRSSALPSIEALRR